MAASVRYFVDDVAAAIRFYERLGFEVHMHPGPGFAMLQREDEIIAGTGGRQVLADDPSGNPVELFEPRAP